MLLKQKPVKPKYTLSRAGMKFIIMMLFLAPTVLISQSSEEAQAVESKTTIASPWQLDLSFLGHNIFGNAINGLPGETKFGIGYDAAIKYQRGNIGLALSGGFWSTKYDASASGTTFSQRLETISAHYLMFGPYISIGKGKTILEINPKIGIQRFYFPAPIRSNSGILIRTNFDAGISAGLGFKAIFPVDDVFKIHLRSDYMTTLGDQAFQYIYRNGSNVKRNTDVLKGVSLGAGASMALKSKTQNDGSKSFSPTAIDIAAGAGLNFLIGKGIKNLPGEKSAGYDIDLTLNYRIGRSGIALSGGFWDNAYSAKKGTESGTVISERLDNLSAHYISAGPIIPVTSKQSSKMRLELVPHVGIQRIYFPHSTVQLVSTTRRVTTNLQAGWSAGLGANLLIPINEKLDLQIGADYTSTLTDRSFGFTSREGTSTVVNRTPIEKINAGVGIAYNLMEKDVTSDEEITPEDIAEMINAKEDDMNKNDTDTKDSIDMEVGGEVDGMNKEKEGVDTKIETPSTAQPTTEPNVSTPVVTQPSTPTTTRPTTTTPSTPSSTVPSTTTSPVITTPSTPSPNYGNPAPSSNYSSDNNVVYRVQFVALSKDAKVFNQLKQYGTVILEYYSTKGLYRYMVGDASTKEEGMAILKRVNDSGWPKAFLVKYENGTRTRIYE